MNTIRLYKENVYLKETSAFITSVAEVKGKAVVTLNQTIFFPEGGGQSCDRGTIGSYQVLDVYEKEQEVHHLLDCTVDEINNINLEESLDLKLDWEHRFDNMQRHCGEHIVSGAFFKEYGGVNKGFHMGDNYMTLDIGFETGSPYDKVTWEMAKHVELCANQVIWDNAPVITRHFDTFEEAKALPLRKELAIDEDITIVSIGSTDKPSDCVSCCGTHPSTAGQVGMIKLYKVESNKGMTRIYMEAGKRAFCKYQNEFDVLTELGNKLSAGTEDILKKYKAQQDKNSEARYNLGNLRRYVVAQEVDKVKKLLAECGNNNPVVDYEVLTVDDMLNIVKEVTDLIPKILFLVHRPSNTVLLCSNGKKIHCGNLVKENANIYGGKGGGNATSARAIFSREDYVDTFIDLIDKHLR